ncbi:MAG: 5-dehydro-4-deoxy-D-glucuronate isomerase [Bacteroidota bacterium]|jgi:4-deoxy-L-threo-5-hexosulose-uronate ketol-isomerase
MSKEVRFSRSAEEVKTFTTAQLRQNFLIENIFQADSVSCTYSMQDRFIILGIQPVSKSIQLPVFQLLTKAHFFLERREIGIINVGGAGRIVVDGTVFSMQNKDGLYIGRGKKEVFFESLDPQHPALFYANSCTAHAEYPSVHIQKAAVQPLDMGDFATANKRLIYQYIIPNRLKTCQLVMGFTELQSPSVWNTIPPHTHLRRNEVYFYFDVPENQFVMHFMGAPQETKHIVVRNHQSVISPEWSIHAGAGSASYSFIWAMAGENQDYTDMDKVELDQLL